MVNQVVINQISYLLDTNVISELIKPEQTPHVLKYFEQYQQEIAIPSLVWHELRFGWLKMPDGQRKQAIGAFLHDVVSLLPVFSYDTQAARVHAEIRLQSQQAGLVIPFVDGQIAAITMAQGFILVTRNTKDFQNIQGLRLENWFK